MVHTKGERRNVPLFLIAMDKEAERLAEKNGRKTGKLVNASLQKKADDRDNVFTDKARKKDKMEQLTRGGF